MHPLTNKIKTLIPKKVSTLLIILFTVFLSCNNDKYSILVIGDSISNGYYPFLKKELSHIANVDHINKNAKHTNYGLENIESWLEPKKWELIIFNWGLWDLCYRTTIDSIYKKDKLNGIQEVNLEEYRFNLDSLVGHLQKTNAQLVFVTTTYVPSEEPGMFTKDVLLYNNIAKEIMKKHSVNICDVYNESIKVHENFGISVKNVHYKRKGYKKLGKYIAEYIEDFLVDPE